MTEQVRMLFVFSVAFVLMILSINLSTYASESKILKEDLEVAVHDAGLQVDKQALSNGYIVFDKEKAKETFKETIELNTGMVEGEDYSLIEWLFFDHSTHPSGFACENNGAAPIEFSSGVVDASFTISCPTIVAIVKHTSDNYLYLAGDSRDGKDIIKSAAYSYELDPRAVETMEITSLALSEPNVMLNMELIKEGDFYWPVPYTKNITSHFNPKRLHPTKNIIESHNGTDISSRGIENQPAVSILDGIVTYAGSAGTYGNIVEVTHENGMITRYAHLNKVLVKKGQKLSGGDVLGLIGSTGDSTGPHLHFEVLINGEYIDPVTLFN